MEELEDLLQRQAILAQALLGGAVQPDPDETALPAPEERTRAAARIVAEGTTKAGRIALAETWQRLNTAALRAEEFAGQRRSREGAMQMAGQQCAWPGTEIAAERALGLESFAAAIEPLTMAEISRGFERDARRYG